MIAADYIEQLQKAILKTNYLAYSGTVTTAGAIDTTHRRFIQCPRLMFYKPVPEEEYAKASFEYDISTFCGLLVNADMVRKIGLPKQNISSGSMIQNTVCGSMTSHGS